MTHAGSSLPPMPDPTDMSVGLASSRFKETARDLLGQLLTAFEQEMGNAYAESMRLRSELIRLKEGDCQSPVLMTPRDDQWPSWPEDLLASLPTLCEQYMDLEENDTEPSSEPTIRFPEASDLNPAGFAAGFQVIAPKPSNPLPLEVVPQPKNSGGVQVGDDASFDINGKFLKVSDDVKVGDEMTASLNGKHVAQEVRSSGNPMNLSHGAATPRDVSCDRDKTEEDQWLESEARFKPNRVTKKRSGPQVVDKTLWAEAENLIKQSGWKPQEEDLHRQSKWKKKSKTGSSSLSKEAEARVAAEVLAQTYQREAATKRITKAQRNTILPPREKLTKWSGRRRTTSSDRRKTSITGSETGVDSTSDRLFDIDVDVTEEAMRLAQEHGIRNSEVLFEEIEDRSSIRGKAAYLVGNIYFDMFFGLVIIVNSIFMGVQIDFSVSHPSAETPAIFYVFGYIFTLVFVFELCCRIVATPSCYRFVCSSESWHWNWLDLIIVGSSLVEILFDVIYFTSSSRNDSINMSNMRIVRIIRLTRLLRVLRIGRIVRFIRALRILVFSILNTLRTVFWALLLLVMIIYVFGMVFAQVVSDHISSASTHREDLWVYWGTLPRSIFTLFKAIASGVSWHDVVEPLAVLHPAWVGLFVIYISFTFFAVLNVITGIFCERAIESVRQDHELVVQQHLLNRALYVQTVKRLFEAIDVDDSNNISYKEFEMHLRDEHAVAFFAALELETNNAWEVFRLIDTNGEDGIDCDEFVEGCLRLRGTAKAIDIAKLQYEVRKFNQGILRMLKHLGHAVERTHQAVHESRRELRMSNWSAHQ